VTPQEELQRFHDHCRDEIIKTLVMTIGECLTADPYATSTLLLRRGVECNQTLALHPFVPVEPIGTPENPGYKLSTMGLLNAVVAKLTGCYMVTTAELDKTSEGQDYEKITKIDLRPREDFGC
jgi:hypothetical protein